jgi:hypothetical protein
MDVHSVNGSKEIEIGLFKQKSIPAATAKVRSLLLSSVAVKKEKLKNLVIHARVVSELQQLSDEWKPNANYQPSNINLNSIYKVFDSAKRRLFIYWQSPITLCDSIAYQIQILAANNSPVTITSLPFMVNMKQLPCAFVVHTIVEINGAKYRSNSSKPVLLYANPKEKQTLTQSTCIHFISFNFFYLFTNYIFLLYFILFLLFCFIFLFFLSHFFYCF